ncbi:hypothetical protein Hdeb2414_s0004g00137611 [Helianthus debilis subsp. tardiflorus]
MGVSLSYLGGLYMLVKFEDEVSCVNFMTDHSCWKDWFSILDPWDNQSLPFERLAWVKVLGVPMHLADNDVLNNIAEQFGKIVHGSQLEAEDGNLSVSWIGLLVGEGVRIQDQVTLRWKNKQFRVWVEEVINELVPDSIGKVVVPTVVSSPLGQSSGDNHRKEDAKGISEDNGPVPLAKRRSECMSVGQDQEAEKVVDIKEEEATSQLIFNDLNLADNVIGEVVRSMENPKVCHDDRRNVGNSKEGGKPMQERENMGVEHSIGSVRIHDTKVEREGGVISGVKEPQFREGGPLWLLC